MHLNSRLELQPGPLNLTVGRASRAWLLASAHAAEQGIDMPPHCRVRKGLPEPFDERYTHTETLGRLRLESALADQPIVVRPYQPALLPGHEEISFEAAGIGGPLAARSFTVELDDSPGSPTAKYESLLH